MGRDNRSIGQLVCKYQCRKCRVLFERDKPGPVICPECGNLYVDWLNFEKVLAFIHRKEK